ncbi:hypothetical protein EXS74_00585 [Candidatus Woesearchaeota archaeon]|nr:hypothetical protein [Candidatus Woesearchaeota archaeon]
MYYTAKKRAPGHYGQESYSPSTPSLGTYSPSSALGSTPVIKQNRSSSRCCGRGCKPCVDDLGF